MEKTVILETKELTKSFPGVCALKAVNLVIMEGEVHCIVGMNGAGKSTLIKLLMGALMPDSGEILVEGESVRFLTPAQAQAKGIACVYQELDLIPDLDVVENVWLNHEKVGKRFLLNRRAMEQETLSLLSSIGVSIPLNVQIRHLTVSERQLVALARALSFKPRILIMDEPTSALSRIEQEHLFNIVRQLRNNKISVIYISHRLEEIMDIGDRVTVLRDGQLVSTKDINDVTKEHIIEMMLGRKLENEFPERREVVLSNISAETVLSVRHLSIAKKVHDVSFDLKHGEILGFFGMVGAGKTEILKALVGAIKSKGQIMIEGKELQIRSPIDALRHGIGLIPEDRKDEGILSELSVMENVGIVAYHRARRMFLINFQYVEKLVQEYVSSLDIKTPSLRQLMRNLSGGNQQKAIVARWLVERKHILLLDEPTRGIDVNSKADIYRLIFQLAAEGISIIVASSELEEITHICDRILIIYDGHIVREVNAGEVSNEEILFEATGGLQYAYN